MLATAAVLALAADRLSAAPSGFSAPGAQTVGDIGGFMSPVTGDAPFTPSEIRVLADPLASREIAVARDAGGRTVQSSGRTRQLTAILITDEKPVAVIDGSVVNVGDTLPDGGRVGVIREDRVAIVDRNGQWRVLTISAPRP